MTSVIVKIIDSLVSQQVFVVEEQTIDTQTVSQLELIVHIPVILDIGTGTVELYAGSRLRLTVVTISQTDDFRCSTIHEILHAGIAVVTCTVTHILVVGHLMLEGDTTHDLMGTQIIGQVVLDVPNGIVNGVVPCEELITESHIVVVATIEDIDEGELRRVGTTDIIEF